MAVLKLLDWVSGTTRFWLLVGAAWLVLRRLSGAFESPLATSTICAVAVGANLMAWLAAKAWSCDVSSRRPVSVLLVSIALIAMAAALSLPGTSLVGLVLLWTTVLTTIGWLGLYVGLDPRRMSPFDRLYPQTKISKNDVSVAKCHANLGESDRSEFLEGGPLGDGVDQRLTYGHDEAGRCYIQGHGRAVIPAGHRSTRLHLAICPPLENAPDVQFEQVDGPPVDISLGMRLPHGFRFDLRRSGSTDREAVVVLEFYATAGEPSAIVDS